MRTTRSTRTGGEKEPRDDGQDPVETIDPTPLFEAASQARKSFGRFNLAIAGGTGVGKSSLLNAVFGEDRAATGIGLPVTRGIHYYVNHDKTLGIWDFEGFEVGTALTPAQMVQENLSTIATGPPEKQVSVVWYCVLSSVARLTPAEMDAIRAFDAAGKHIIIVLTKVRRARNLAGRWTLDEDAEKFLDFLADPRDHRGEPIDLPTVTVIATAAVDQGKYGPKHGLADLMTATLGLSPEGAQDAFRVAQRLSLPLKLELARRFTAAAAVSAAAAAAVPVPFADAALLAPIQLGMMGKISAVYGIDLRVVLSAQALSQLATQIAGKALARSVVKLIPGAGSVINASVAAALTAASGEAWTRICERVFTGELKLDDVESLWSSYGPTVTQVLGWVLKIRTNSTIPLVAEVP
ncbi:GTPase [Oerskovia enterophila]|uniref:GTPase n=1 Tax=Oerskovia enterophila TaxID=43678 RepID=UPI00339B7EBE